MDDFLSVDPLRLISRRIDFNTKQGEHEVVFVAFLFAWPSDVHVNALVFGNLETVLMRC